MTVIVESHPQQVVARVFDEFIDRLLSSNDPKSVPIPPAPPEWYALNTASRNEVFERVKLAVGNAIGGPWKRT